MLTFVGSDLPERRRATGEGKFVGNATGCEEANAEAALPGSRSWARDPSFRPPVERIGNAQIFPMRLKYGLASSVGGRLSIGYQMQSDNRQDASGGERRPRDHCRRKVPSERARVCRAACRSSISLLHLRASVAQPVTSTVNGRAMRSPQRPIRGRPAYHETICWAM